MLPILRILPVGGVLLAILILVLALSPPDGSRAPLSSAMATGRGVLADRDRQSEVRQYLIHAALKRADELNRLRDLPDGRRPAQRPDRRRSGRNRDDPRDAGRHHPDRDRRTLLGRIASRRAADAATVVATRGIVVCQESRAGQTAAGCAPSRLPGSPADKSRR